MTTLYHFLWCGLLRGSRLTVTEWLPVGVVDWVRVWTCSRCKAKWEEFR